MEAYLKAFDSAVAKLFDAPAPQIDPVEKAINEASPRQWDKMLEHFGYAILSNERDAFEPINGHYTTGGDEYYIERHGHVLNDGEPYPTYDHAYGEALEHLQENIDGLDILEFLGVEA